MAIIPIIVICVAAAIGAIVGVFKRFGNTSFWGATVLLTLLIVQAVGQSVKKGANGYAIAVLISAVACLLVFTILFAAMRRVITKGAEKCMALNHYKNADAREENDEYIRSALDQGDRKAYKKYLKQGKKIKDSAGGWGVVDAIFGLIFGAINVAIAVGAVLIFFLMIVDISQISALTNAFSSILTAPIWAKIGAKVALDYLLICVLSLCIRTGFKGGLSSFLCTIVIVGLLVSFLALSYVLASSEAFSGAVQGISQNLLGSLPENMNNIKELLAKIIIAAVLFILSLVIVVIVGIFLPRLVEKFRESKPFYAIDGVLGAIVLTAFIFGLCLAAGGVSYTLHDLSFMEKFNSYEASSHFADCLYAYNPAGSLFENLPLHDWLTPPQS